jgi:hypothetical protein
VRAVGLAEESVNACSLKLSYAIIRSEATSRIVTVSQPSYSGLIWIKLEAALRSSEHHSTDPQIALRQAQSRVA